MARLIGTAGHVDHGKTSLIRALTGIDADRLPEERERGMTIDIGFAYLDLPDLGRVSIVDVPGHEKFLTNMLVGALGIDVALLCVSADESVMPQTREHLQILELLPVEKLVVAMTRSDLADEDTRLITAEEIVELIAKSRFKVAPIIVTSATEGLGLDELKAALTSAMQEETKASTGPWYLPIDRAFSVKGHGCVVTGTLARGTVKLGDRAFLEPGHVEVRVRAIHCHSEPTQTSERGRRTALNLGGIKLEDVRRGQALGAVGALFETSCLDAEVHWVAEPKHGLRIRVSIGAEEAIGKLFLNDTEPSLIQIRLETPVAAALDQPLIVRRYSPPDLLCGGRVTVPQAKQRRKSEAAALLKTGSDEEPILQVVGENSNGVPTEEICRALGKTPQALGDTFEKLSKAGRLRGFAGLWFSIEAFEEGASRFQRALRELHEESPTQGLIQRDRALSRSGLKWSGKPLDRIIAWLDSEGRIEAVGTGLRDSAFKVKLTERQRTFLDRAVAAIEAEEVNTPNPYDLAKILVVPPQATEEILKLGVQAGELVQIGEGIFYTPAQLNRLRDRIRTIAAGKSFAASQLRDALSTSRKYVIPLLEYFDKQRFTTRVGDMRMLND